MRKDAKLKKRHKIFLNAKIISVVTIMALGLSTCVAFAQGDATGAWNKVMDTVLDWIPAIAAVLVVIGGIEFGFAFKSEDPEGKTKALRTVAAGAIVAAICVALASYTKIGGGNGGNTLFLFMANLIK